MEYQIPFMLGYYHQVRKYAVKKTWRHFAPTASPHITSFSFAALRIKSSSKAHFIFKHWNFVGTSFQNRPTKIFCVHKNFKGVNSLIKKNSFKQVLCKQTMMLLDKIA